MSNQSGGSPIFTGGMVALSVILILVALPFYFAAAYLSVEANYAFYGGMAVLGVILCIGFYSKSVKALTMQGIEPGCIWRLQFLAIGLFLLTVCWLIAGIGFYIILPDINNIKNKMNPPTYDFANEPYAAPEGYRGYTYGYWDLYENGDLIGKFSFKVYGEDQFDREGPIQSARLLINNEVFEEEASEKRRFGDGRHLVLSGDFTDMVFDFDEGELRNGDKIVYTFRRQTLTESLLPNNNKSTWENVKSYAFWLGLLVLMPCYIIYWIYCLFKKFKKVPQ